MMLADVIDAYLTRQRSLGMRFDSAGQLLRRFSRAIGDRPIQEVTPEAVLDFLHGKGALTATWTLKYKVLTGLYRFAISRGYVDSSPLPTDSAEAAATANALCLFHRRTPPAAGGDNDPCARATARHVPAMYRTLLLLLYGSGMRIGEALRLTLQDVDLAEQVITVRDTKFFKTRLVPIGPKLTAGTRCAYRAPRLAPNAAQRMHRRYSRRVTVEDGVIRESSRCSSMSVEPPESIAPSANLALHACTIIRHTAAVHRVRRMVSRRPGRSAIAPATRHLPWSPRYPFNPTLSPDDARSLCRRPASALPSTQWGPIMKDENLLGPWVRRFLLEHLVAERNLSRNTQASYRDTLMLLLPFASKHGGVAIDRMTVEDLTPSIVRTFLDHLEHDRQCSGVTRNQRLATIHSLARFIGMRSPVHVAWCAEIRAVPFKKTAKTVIGYLEKAEMDALLNQPDRRTRLGARDHALLLFLYNSGARADEAARSDHRQSAAWACPRQCGCTEKETSSGPVLCGRLRPTSLSSLVADSRQGRGGLPESRATSH